MATNSKALMDMWTHVLRSSPNGDIVKTLLAMNPVGFRWDEKLPDTKVRSLASEAIRSMHKNVTDISDGAWLDNNGDWQYVWEEIKSGSSTWDIDTWIGCIEAMVNGSFNTNYSNVSKVLLDSVPDTVWKSLKKESLEYYLEKVLEKGDGKFTRKLLDLGCNPNKIVSIPMALSSSGEKFVHNTELLAPLLCVTFDEDCIKSLLEYGADPLATVFNVVEGENENGRSVVDFFSAQTRNINESQKVSLLRLLRQAVLKNKTKEEQIELNKKWLLALIQQVKVEGNFDYYDDLEVFKDFIATLPKNAIKEWDLISGLSPLQMVALTDGDNLRSFIRSAGFTEEILKERDALGLSAVHYLLMGDVYESRPDCIHTWNIAEDVLSVDIWRKMVARAIQIKNDVPGMEESYPLSIFRNGRGRHDPEVTPTFSQRSNLSKIFKNMSGRKEVFDEKIRCLENTMVIVNKEISLEDQVELMRFAEADDMLHIAIHGFSCPWLGDDSSIHEVNNKDVADVRNFLKSMNELRDLNELGKVKDVARVLETVVDMVTKNPNLFELAVSLMDKEKGCFWTGLFKQSGRGEDSGAIWDKIKMAGETALLKKGVGVGRFLPSKGWAL